jgi:hypothetical protein
MLRRRHSSALFNAVLVAAIVTGCGSDSTGPSHANVTGVWTLSATNLTGAGFSCNIFGTSLFLNQSGTSFNGTYSGGSFSCEGIDLGQPAGSVVNGIVNLQQVSFDMDTQDFHFTGAVSGESMSGSATMRLVIEGTTYTLSGSWSASRQ